jgi:hypothetical protein
MREVLAALPLTEQVALAMIGLLFVTSVAGALLSWCESRRLSRRQIISPERSNRFREGGIAQGEG